MKKLRFIIATIVMMGMTVTRRVTVVLNYPADIDDFIVYAKAIHQSMVASPLFGASAGKLGTLATDITSLENSHVGVNATVPTHTTAFRDGELLKVQNGLRSLRMDVQILVDADPTNAETIVAAADMRSKQFGTFNKQDFEAKRGTLTETAKLVAKGLRERSANDWGMSLDGTNWIPIDPTLAAN